MSTTDQQDEKTATAEAICAFERVAGVKAIGAETTQAGNQIFLKFLVGREAPVYTFALREVQRNLSPENPFLGALGIKVQKPENFPASPESYALLNILTRSTREVAQSTVKSGYVVPYVPFQNQEDHQLSQPASHIVRGRRGVGKSTLIRRSIEILEGTHTIVAVLDMQTYAGLAAKELIQEVMYDVCQGFATSVNGLVGKWDAAQSAQELHDISAQVLSGELALERAPVVLKRTLARVTSHTHSHAFLYLDDFHLVDNGTQPELLHTLHGALKGADGWLKVAGLSSLLNHFDPVTRHGLQVPGDAQFISLDLTLTNPATAESHLKAILESFLKAVGYSFSSSVISPTAFNRLVWANAGVPRDFLQMFARSLEHAQRNRHTTVTLSDVNIAIGEFGQQKMDDLERDARNEAGALREMLSRLEAYCLDEKAINAFLVRSEESRERKLIHALADLRMVHLIHQSITPHRAGERFEAFILDYSLFTGFRRKRNVNEMVPRENQFKAAELRALPSVSADFMSQC